MRKPTQKDRVLRQMRETGSVTRNWCLSQFISRLSAIILDLKAEGYNIEGKWKENDYEYTLVKDIMQKKEYYVNGQLVATTYK